MNKQAAYEVLHLTPARETIVNEEMLKELPTPAQRYLRRAGVVGKRLSGNARFKQHGQLRLADDKPWMEFESEQYISTGTPAFLWDAHVKLFGLPVIHPVDTYSVGHGSMLIKAGGIFTVGKDSGPEVDQGSMTRFLSEMVLMPSGFLQGRITFNEIDNNSVGLAFEDGGKSVNATMTFDEEGLFKSFFTRRYLKVGGNYELTDWLITAVEQKAFAGITIPSKTLVTWQKPSGDFEWLRMTIDEAEFNAKEPY